MQYPYFIVPAVEEYKTLDPSSERAKELGRLIEANVGDRASLRLILETEHLQSGNFPEDLDSASQATLDTIDSFLNKFGSKTTSGYFHETHDLNSLIKQERYEEAIVLIEQQNLNNPKKSIYFALQIRFLKKLIALQKHRNNNRGC